MSYIKQVLGKRNYQEVILKAKSRATHSSRGQLLSYRIIYFYLHLTISSFVLQLVLPETFLNMYASPARNIFAKIFLYLSFFE